MCTIFFSLLQGHSETRSVLQYSPDQWFNTVGHQCESWQRVVSQLCVCRLPQEGRYHCQKVSVSHVQNLDWNLKALVSKFNMEKKECTKKEKEKKHFNFSGTTNSYNIIYTKTVSNLHSIPCVFSDLIHVSCCYLETRSVNLNLTVLTSVSYLLLGREHSYAESWVRCKKLNNSCLWGITVKGN